MRTAAATRLTLTALIGISSFALVTACKQTGPSNGNGGGSGGSSGSGGSGGSSSTGGSGSGGSSSTGGSGSGGSSSTGGSGSGGATSAGGNGSGGATSMGGSGSGGASSTGGNGSGGATSTGGSGEGGSSGSGGGGEGGSGGSADGGASGSGGSGDGGNSGSGGSTGAGGSTSSGLDCQNAIVPANGSNGGVTDFSDWNESSGKWGSPSGLFGAVYSYPGPNSNMSNKVEGTPKGLHLTGGVASGDYGGGGLSFYVCATVASFTQVQFDIVGSSPGCDLELQIQTFDQRPKTQTPAGGCDSNCYNFPTMKKIADLSTAITSLKTVTAPLSSFSNWSSANAAQVVGLQWQFTGTTVDGDAGTTCPIDATITNIKFLP